MKMDIPRSKMEMIQEQYVREIIWKNVIYFILVHLYALYGLYLVFTSAKLITTFFAFVLYLLSIFGIAAGTHRFWSHKSYNARFPLRLLFMIFFSLSAQGPIWKWCRYHRLHHKFSETDGDPSNINRGFFFAHIGWLLLEEHPEVKKKAQTIDMSDLENDSIVMFQKKYYWYLIILLNVFVPTFIPVFIWNESWKNSIFVPLFLRYICSLNMAGLINSAAHTIERKPFNRFICATENIILSVGSVGEAWHNYHHTFPGITRHLNFLAVDLTGPLVLLIFFLKLSGHIIERLYHLRLSRHTVKELAMEHIKFGAGVTKTRLPTNEKKTL